MFVHVNMGGMEPDAINVRNNFSFFFLSKINFILAVCSEGCPESYICVGPDNCFGTTAMRTTAMVTTAIPVTTHSIWRFTTQSFTTAIDEDEEERTGQQGLTTGRAGGFLDGNISDISPQWIGTVVGIGAGVCCLFCIVGFLCAALSKKRQVKRQGVQMTAVSIVFFFF